MPPTSLRTDGLNNRASSAANPRFRASFLGGAIVLFGKNAPKPRGARIGATSSHRGDQRQLQ